MFIFSLSANQKMVNRMMLLLNSLEYTLCWNAEPYDYEKLRPAVYQQCDFFVPTFNIFIINRTWTLEKFIWRRLLFVCNLNCWKLVLPINHWCIKLKEGTKQLHGSLNQTVCLRLHNLLPFAQTNFQVPQLQHIPST